jgi:hypothetical protein
VRQGAPSLIDRLDQVTNLLDMSKREFIEAAVSDALARAEEAIERSGALDQGEPVMLTLTGTIRAVTTLGGGVNKKTGEVIPTRPVLQIEGLDNRGLVQLFTLTVPDTKPLKGVLVNRCPSRCPGLLARP